MSEIAHVQKQTKANMQGLSNHLDRKTENHSNEDIDIERSHLNYDLCEKEGDTLSRMNERLEEVYCMNRKDVNVCCTWIVTLPENLKDAPDEHQRKFFETTNDFLTDRYGGEKNVISANVHNDETTAHMHFAFIPVVWDEKKQREKVSAKIVIHRSELNAFHGDLDNHLKDKIPEIYQEGILNKKTIGLDDIKSIKKYSKKIEERKEELTMEFEAYFEKEKGEMTKGIEEYRALVEKDKRELTKELTTFKEPKVILEKVEKSIQKSMMGLGKGIVLPPEDYERLKKLAGAGIKEKQNLNNYKERTSKEINDLEGIVQFASKKITNLEGKNEKLEVEVAGLKKHKTNEIIFKSMLQDDDRDLNISQTERNGRIILFNLESGHEPDNREQAETWTSTLEENKRLKTIPQGRLQRGLDKVKQFLDKLLSRDFSMESILRKVQEDKAREPKTKKKSRGMEL